MALYFARRLIVQHNHVSRNNNGFIHPVFAGPAQTSDLPARVSRENCESRQAVIREIQWIIPIADLFILKNTLQAQAKRPIKL